MENYNSESNSAPQHTKTSDVVVTKFISMRHHELKDFPPHMFAAFPNMISLDLRNNRIAILPSQISKLSNLHSLRVDYNLLEVLPP